MHRPANLWTKLSSLSFVMFIAVVVGGMTVLSIPMLQKRHSLQSELVRVEADIAKQEALERQQRAEIESLRTDPVYVERTAREKLNLSRPDEVIFRFEPAPQPQKPPTR